MSKLWITWEKQRRNRGISSGLGYDLHEIISRHSGLRRYLECTVSTLKLLRILRPSYLAVQNPSIVLACLGLLLHYVFKFKFIIDAHNAGIFPAEGRSRLLNFLSKILQKKADLVIVTNENLKEYVEGNGGVAFVLPDRIPVPQIVLDCIPLPKKESKTNICFICTFAQDEPYQDVITATSLLPDTICVHVTGKYANKVDPVNVPKNLCLLGYLSEEKFWETLSSCDLVMDLTTRQDCLVCGAYEGISLQKPLVLSDTEMLREYFSKGCVYVDSNPESIAAGILLAVEQYSHLKEEICELKVELEKDWNERADKLLAELVRR